MAAQIRQGLRDDPAAWRGQMEQLYPRQFMGETLPSQLHRQSLTISIGANPVSKSLELWLYCCSATIAVFGLSSFELTSRTSYLMTVGCAKIGKDLTTPRVVAKSKRREVARRPNPPFCGDGSDVDATGLILREIADWCSELGGSIVSDEDGQDECIRKALR